MDDNKLRDILYRHVTAAQGIGLGLAGDFVSQLNAVDDDLLDQITKRYARIEADGFDRGPATTKRLEEMLVAVREVNAKAYKNGAAGLTKELGAIAAHEAEFAAKAVKSAGGVVDFRTTIPSADFIKALVQNTPLPFADDGHTLLMPWLSTQEAGRLRRLEGALRLGIFEGQSTGQLVARIRGTKASGYTLGPDDKQAILQTSRKDATTIALTANGAIQNAARSESYSRMKSVRYVEWSAILDDRTSKICMSRSGTVYVKGSKHPQPPAHPRCRSMLLPRSNNEGSKHKPYGEWLRDQSEAVQNEVMEGKARGDVFRANPDFDFQGYFREGGGSFKTLGELRQFDERLFAEGGVKSPAKPKAKPEAPKAPPATPERAPEPPERLTSAIDPAINDNTVPVISKREATKRLTPGIAEAASSPIYETRAEYRSVKPEHFGKVTLGTNLSDEAASAMAALWPELDRIADAFAMPRLRGIKGVGGQNAIASMGDGILNINATHFNGFASRVGLKEAGAESAAISKAKGQQSKWKAELMEIAAKLGAMQDDLARLSNSVENREARFALAAQIRALAHDHRKLAQKEFKLRNMIRTMERQGGGEPVSEWKVGDDIKLRPYTNDKYFNGIDKMRSTLYHEFGHQVHQMWKKNGRRYIGSRKNNPPLEDRLSSMFFTKFHGAAPGNIGGRGIDRKNQLTTTYATTNEFEWWAESFSAYMMGRPDLADPDLVKLIEELLDEAAGR